jgi:hypothetical protein
MQVSVGWFAGKEKAPGPLWAAADEQLLKRIARTSMQLFVVLVAAHSGPAPVVRGSSRPSLLSAGWFDDWAPEASGIFGSSSASRRDRRSRRTPGHPFRPTKSRFHTRGRHQP